MRLVAKVMFKKRELLILRQALRETRALDSASWHCNNAETRVLTLASWYCSDATAVMLRRGFRPLRLGAVVVAMISPASGVWTLLFDDLSSVIFRQPTEPPPKFSIFRG